MKKVELIGLSKSYDKQVDVISNLNITIEPSDFFLFGWDLRIIASLKQEALDQVVEGTKRTMEIAHKTKYAWTSFT